MNRIKENIKKLYWKTVTKQLEGIGIIEIILILVIIIGLVLIFRNEIEGIIQAAFGSINGDASGINEAITVDPE